MHSLMRFLAGLVAAPCVALGMSPAHASVGDQFPCRSADYASLLVTISALDTTKAVMQATKEYGGEEHAHELALKPGGTWLDFRYQDDAGHVFEGGNGGAVLLMHGKAYFCEYAGETGVDGAAYLPHVQLLLRGDGLEIRVQDIPQPVGLMFGDRKADVVARLWEAFGSQGEESADAECGAGPMAFMRFGAFTANFSDGEWIGWSLDGGKTDPDVELTLSGGVGIGSPVSALGDKVEWFEQSTLGNEFTLGGISGFSAGKDKDSPIGALWAGVNCHFR